MSGHTEGTWRACIRRDGARIEAHYTHPVAWVGPDQTEETDSGRIVEVMSVEAQANAHLIAAAPDMLEALERLQLEAWHFLENGRGQPHLKEAIGRARAAIAKARGGA